ncbi:MAG TPA: hypothetical protein ENJ18_12080 [Nannocystis exedens]|nr:hypothetical protein [Nannocystis exedens]
MKFRVRIRPLALALTLPLLACPGTGSDSDTDGDSGEEDNTLCSLYVACITEVDPGRASDLDLRLGEQGSCWRDAITVQAQCVDECATGFDKATLDDPSNEICKTPSKLNDAIFEIGQALFDPNDPFADPVWAPLATGGSLELVLGGQGLLMFPIGLRGANFVVADDPSDFADPKMPQVDMWMDIEGYNIGVAGHFARIYNFPIPFKPLDGSDEIYEFLYIAVIVPDEISDPMVLDGKPGHLWIELNTYDDEPTLRELDVTITVPSDNF